MNNKIYAIGYLCFLQNRRYLHLDEKSGQDVYIHSLRKHRIYLDEYPEQKELRKNWFGKHHDCFKHIYTRFLKRN